MLEELPGKIKSLNIPRALDSFNKRRSSLLEFHGLLQYLIEREEAGKVVLQRSHSLLEPPSSDFSHLRLSYRFHSNLIFKYVFKLEICIILDDSGLFLDKPVH